MTNEKQQTFIRCLSCRSLVPESSESCRMCGASLSTSCPRCTESVPATSSICKCGAPIVHETKPILSKLLVVLIILITAFSAYVFLGQP